VALVRGLKCENQIFLFDYSDTWIKTHKRNITVPLYTATFGDAVVKIYLEHHSHLVMYFIMKPPWKDLIAC
jgi:hypothetical protein